jgi:hypothetical protein
MNLPRALIVSFFTSLPLLSLCGCAWEQVGLGSSDGRFSYASRPDYPYNVSLVNTSTGEELWTYEVPVGKQLNIRFLEGYDAKATGQDVMKWDISPIGRATSTLANSMPCPAATSRILKVYVRERPENYPAKAVASTPPVPAPSVPPSSVPTPTDAAPAVPSPIPPAPAPETMPAVPSPTESPSQPATPDNQPATPPVDLPQ